MQRNHQLDAVKFFLILGVVLGHTIERSRDAPGFDLLYHWLYLFHMPAFIFLSGMVSSEVIDGKRARGLLYCVLLPLMVHQLLLSGLASYLSGGAWKLSLSTPAWAMWYLLSLLCWRLMLPLFAVLRAPLLVAVLVSLVAGLDSRIGTEWSLSRTFALLPFFITGYLWRKQQAQLQLPSFDWRLALLGLLQLIAVAYIAQRVNIQWLYWKTSYSGLGVDAMTGMVCRGALLVVGVLGGWCFISVVQRFRGVNEKISEFGVTSMAPYLLHIYFLLIAQKYGMANWLETISPLAAWCIVLTCSLAMTVVFAQIGRRWTWLFDFSWLGQVTEYVAKQLNKKFI